MNRAFSFDDFVGHGEQCRRNLEAKHLRCFQVDQQLELRCLYHWKVSGRFTVQNSTSIHAGLPIDIGNAWSRRSSAQHHQQRRCRPPVLAPAPLARPSFVLAAPPLGYCGDRCRKAASRGVTGAGLQPFLSVTSPLLAPHLPNPLLDSMSHLSRQQIRASKATHVLGSRPAPHYP